MCYYVFIYKKLYIFHGGIFYILRVWKASATDGMIFDKKGNLYLGDLENHKIMYMTPKKTLKTLVSKYENISIFKSKIIR